MQSFGNANGSVAVLIASQLHPRAPASCPVPIDRSMADAVGGGGPIELVIRAKLAASFDPAVLHVCPPHPPPTSNLPCFVVALLSKLGAVRTFGVVRALPAPISRIRPPLCGCSCCWAYDECRAAAAWGLGQVINESSGHNVPKGSESHFKVVVVSAAFDGVKLLERHRQVNDCLADELANSIHALSIKAQTPAQWEKNPAVGTSPPCLGGNGL